MLRRSFGSCWGERGRQKGKKSITIDDKPSSENIQSLDLQSWFYYVTLIQQVFIKHLHDQTLL